MEGALRKLDESMAAFRNRKIYRKLSIEVLAAIPDDKLEQAIIDFVAEKTASTGGDERATLKSLSVGFRAVYATWVLEGEVDNGGFNQFFWNHSDEMALDAVDGLADHVEIRITDVAGIGLAAAF